MGGWEGDGQEQRAGRIDVMSLYTFVKYVCLDEGGTPSQSASEACMQH